MSIPRFVIGIDPGATTGWCLYDRELHRPIASEHTDGHVMPTSQDIRLAITANGGGSAIVIERPKGYGATYPQVVDAAYVCGRIVGRLGVVEEMTRRDVCAILSDATFGAVRVKNDASAWAALVLMHGDGSDRKPKVKKGQIVEAGGALGEVSSHCRAALAVAVAWLWREEGKKP